MIKTITGLNRVYKADGIMGLLDAVKQGKVYYDDMEVEGEVSYYLALSLISKHFGRVLDFVTSYNNGMTKFTADMANDTLIEGEMWIVVDTDAVTVCVSYSIDLGEQREFTKKVTTKMLKAIA